MKLIQESKFSVIEALLEKDRPYAVLALTCLEPEWFGYSRFFLDGSQTAGVWIFEHPQLGNVVQTFGERRGVSALLANLDLPQTGNLTIRREHVNAVARYYDLSHADAEWLMHVTPGSMCHSSTDLAVSELGPSDAVEATALYALWDESAFDPSRFQQGWIYLGLRMEGQLIAIAGNQVRSKEVGVAKVLGVFVHPDWRGRGLGQALVTGITEFLFDYGARDVILHVREDNARAIATYERTGYRRHCRVFSSRITASRESPRALA